MKIILSFELLLLKSDPSFIPHQFWILEFGFKVRLRRINLIKNDRAKRYNKSAIQNPKSKIIPKSWFNGIKMGWKLRATLCVIFITINKTPSYHAEATGRAQPQCWLSINEHYDYRLYDGLSRCLFPGGGPAWRQSRPIAGQPGQPFYCRVHLPQNQGPHQTAAASRAHPASAAAGRQRLAADYLGGGPGPMCRQNPGPAFTAQVHPPH